MLVIHRVTLADQTTYEAAVVGFDQDKDVAVLSIDVTKDKLRPIPIGVSADLLVGQKVYAIGNPVSEWPVIMPKYAFLDLVILSLLEICISFECLPFFFFPSISNNLFLYRYVTVTKFGLDHTLTTGVIR